MNVFFRTLLILSSAVIAYKGASARSPRFLPGEDTLKSRQLLIVLADHPDSTRATLYCFEKVNNKWVAQFSFPAVIGQKGISDDKSEGDLKSPAGIFSLGPAFGYADKKKAVWIRMPYIQATDTLICVDDASSHFYNQLADSKSLPGDWHSHEEMHRKDDAYAWGLFVQYNVNPIKSGLGSCIFLHIWENDHEGTAGCTAMEKVNLLKILGWIRSDKNPLLVQYPKDIYNKIAVKNNFPEIGSPIF